MIDLEELTKKELVQYAVDNNLPPLSSNDRKAEMIEKIQQAEAETSSTQVGIRLLNNVYTPQTGRLEQGIHVINKALADSLLESLTDKVVEILSAKEVAAFYGLGHGDST